MNTTPITRASVALDVLRGLASQGHGFDYIAAALNFRNVPTLSGRLGARWHGRQVKRLADAHGVTVAFGRRRA